MDKKKVIICRCEDLTLEDVEQAIKDGITTIDGLKRYLRLGMGPCQGRTCIPLAARILRSHNCGGVEEVFDNTVRPPATPIPLGSVAHNPEHYTEVISMIDEGGEDGE